ncbi:MAG TPA: hypothetical protein VHH73_08060 [Verrucomicrobiae bacterium]|nr:hypothetical protein [Verrucomicrobiae bacterium]
MRIHFVKHYCFLPLATSLILLGLASTGPDLHAQGCVQSRGAGGYLLNGEDAYLPANSWQVAIGYRWLNSDRHFVGDQEQKQRQAQGSQVENDSHFIDLTTTYAITKRFSLNLTIPFVYSDRSSLYEHDGVHRHTMSASGLADVRFNGFMWVFDPDHHKDGNIAFGVGMKFPTGDSEATDLSYKATGPVLRYVDQSIQPGDGGWGVTLDMQGFQKIVKNLYAYTQASYLINPQEREPATGYSIPDTYLLRAGLSYVIWPSQGLSLSLGGRMEGVPVTDWFGSSEGSRRPGYSVSIEPGITWVHKKLAITVTAPVAIERNRERSVSDIRTNKHGDAAFADFIITSNISYRF